jgi:hypothetical protein
MRCSNGFRQIPSKSGNCISKHKINFLREKTYKNKTQKLTKKTTLNLNEYEEYNTIVKKTVLDRSVIYWFSNTNTEERENLQKLLNYISIKNNITKLIATGTTKQVFEYNNNFVFKVVITTVDRINNAIKEPIMMKINSKICNKPKKITLYITQKLLNVPTKFMKSFKTKGNQGFPYDPFLFTFN